MSGRIGITGIGLVTPLGVGTAVFDRLCAGESGIAGVAGYDVSGLPCRLGAEVREFQPRDYVAAGALRKMDVNSVRAVAAARMAVDDAGFSPGRRGPGPRGRGSGRGVRPVGPVGAAGQNHFHHRPAHGQPHRGAQRGDERPGRACIHRAGPGRVQFHGASPRRLGRNGRGVTPRPRCGGGRADAMLAGGTDMMGAFFHETLARFRSLSGCAGRPGRGPSLGPGRQRVRVRGRRRAGC